MPNSKLKAVCEVFTAFGIVLIPLVVLYVGNRHNAAIAESESRIKYLEIAISILRDKPKAETSALRDWAIDLLEVQAKSVVPLTAEAKKELKSHAVYRYDYSSYDSYGASYYSGGTVGPGCCDKGTSPPSKTE